MQNGSMSDDGPLQRATLVASRRITPPASAEEVRHLEFRCAEPDFDFQVGQCVRVMAPGEFGNRHHPRLYSIADALPGGGERVDFSLCVRRCASLDPYNGEERRGVASNYLCDLAPGASVEFTGPLGYPFAIPADRQAPLILIGMGTGIAPFRGLVRRIYDTLGGWEGPVRLFYGARSGLEMLYMNDENADLGKYFDRKTFRAFQAVSPRPHFEAPVALDAALAQHAAEVWSLLGEPQTRLFIAGPQALLETVERTLTACEPHPGQWRETREALIACGRWQAVFY